MGDIVREMKLPYYWKEPLFRACGGQKGKSISIFTLGATWKNICSNRFDPESQVFPKIFIFFKYIPLIANVLADTWETRFYHTLRSCTVDNGCRRNTSRTRIPSICPRISLQVNFRFFNPGLLSYFNRYTADKKSSRHGWRGASAPFCSTQLFSALNIFQNFTLFQNFVNIITCYRMLSFKGKENQK